MNNLRYLLPIACMTALCGAAGYADTTSTEAQAGPHVMEHHHKWHHGGDRVQHLLGKLNLTADQKTRVQAIQAGVKSQFVSLETSEHSTREQLATTPPTDSKYPTLIATAKANAAAMIQLRSDIWTQIYAILTPAQQAQIPTVVATMKQSHEDLHQGPNPGGPGPHAAS